MDRKGKKGLVKEYAFIIAGVTILAAAINLFYTPSQLVVGGVTGIGIMLEAVTKELFGYGVPLSVTNLAVNAPLFLGAYFFLGKEVLGRSLFATVYLSFALSVTKYLPVFQLDLLSYAIFGGAITGIGLGLSLRGFATTGGTELAAMLLHKFFGHISVSKLIFLVDAVVIAFGILVFGFEKAMYAVLAVFISSKCIDGILEGMSFAKAAFIISDKSEEIGRRLMEDVKRGVTALHGQGMYTGQERDILLCVFSQKEITKVKNAVSEIDKNAFLIVTDFKEVLGEGFQSMG